MTFTRNGRGASPYQVRLQSNCLIFAKKMSQGHTRFMQELPTIPIHEALLKLSCSFVY
ncbi:MAG: hypothetical protein V3Q69_07020 [Burkholderia sp.]